MQLNKFQKLFLLLSLIYGQVMSAQSDEVTFKSIYKTASLAAIGGKNDIRDYYDYLLSLGTSTRDARNGVARYIAKVSYGTLKNKSKYIPYQWRISQEKKTIEIT